MGTRWQKIEDDLLTNLYPDAEMDELLKIFNRSVTSIQQRGYKLRLKKSEEWRKKHFPNSGVEKQKKQKKKKIMKIKPYEARLLRDPESSKMSITDLCFLMPTRTPSDIKKMKTQLGIE